MNSLLAVSALLTLLQTPAPKPPPDATLTFHFERPGLPVPEYTLTVHADGTGTYTAAYSATPPDTSKYGNYAPAPSKSVPPTQHSPPLTLTPQTTARLFDRIHSTDRFHAGCESKLKGIANTGAKTLTYTGPDGPATCTYNFTEIKALEAVTDTFQGIAATLDEGRTIDLKHRFDRLGLDRELIILTDAVKENRAAEISTIAPILQSLIDDPQVMERVRKRATLLLETAPPK